MNPNLQSAIRSLKSRAAAPWVVLILAALLRLSALDLAAFAYDDADVILRARAVARGELALAGALTSWGVPDPPLLVYLQAAVARVSSAPSVALASLGLMAMLNSLAVLGTYFMVARFFGWRLGLLAGLLYAVNPWAIYFGRRAWVEVQPLFTVLALWAALEVVAARRAGCALLFFVSLAAAVQARLLAVTYAPAALASLALGGRSWLSRWSVLGLVGGALFSLPYLVHLLAERETIAAALAEGNRGVAAVPSNRVLEFTWWFSAGLNLLPTPPRLATSLDVLGVALAAESWLAALLLIAGLAICLSRCIRRAASWRCYALILAWAALPLGLLAWQSSTVYLHYLVLLLPLPFVLMALPLDWLMNGRPILRWLAVVLFLGVALPQAAGWLALLRVLAIYDTKPVVEAPLRERRLLAELPRESAHSIGTGESYGVEVPLRFWLAIGERTRAELAAQPRPLLVVTAGDDPLADERPALLEAVLGRDLAPRYQPANSLVVPLGRPALLLITNDGESPVRLGTVGRQVAVIPLPTVARDDQDAVRLIDLPPRSAAEWAEAVRPETTVGGEEAERPFAFSVAERVSTGQTLGVLTLWQGPRAGFRRSVALIGPVGQRLAERDDPKRKARDLAADELLLTWHEVAVSNRAVAGHYRLVVETQPGQQVDLAPVLVRARP